MASYHLTAKIGTKGKAAAHAAYISREGKYSGRERYEDLEATAAGNMPKWAEHEPANFWNAADEHERANGSAYREIEVALPRELDPAQRRELVEDFVRRELGDQHVYQWAIHTPKAALEKGEQPHAHIMYSERRLDGIERAPDQFFKRYNAKNPERGGAQKASGGKARGALKDELLATRQRWAEVQNEHLARHGHEARVDHRTLEAQGINRGPEKHLGGHGVRALQAQDIAALLERRAAEGEVERTQHQVSSLIDLSGDLAAAKADRSRQQAAEVQKRAVEASAAVVVSRYAQALENVTSETLATVPGLLPASAIKQAIRQVAQEVQAEGQVQEVDVNEVGRQVLAQPALQQRLQQVRAKEATAKATLEEIAGLGFLAGKWKAKGMTETVHKLQTEAKDERSQILADIERSPEVQAARKANQEAKQARLRTADAAQELGQILERSERGQALHERPAHIYRMPETVGRVVNKARAIAPNSLQGMQLAEVERMTDKATDVAWIKPEGVHPHLEKVSRFVVPEKQRMQQLQRSQERDQGPRLG
jgi:hypothetical protein